MHVTLATLHVVAPTYVDLELSVDARSLEARASIRFLGKVPFAVKDRMLERLRKADFDAVTLRHYNASGGGYNGPTVWRNSGMSVALTSTR